MPQFDVFIFFSSLFYLLIGFFSLMFYNQLVFLPKMAAILKLREKIMNSKILEVSQVNSSKNKIIKVSNTLV